jgi:hypothetical protein
MPTTSGRGSGEIVILGADQDNRRAEVQDAGIGDYVHD